MSNILVESQALCMLTDSGLKGLNFAAVKQNPHLSFVSSEVSTERD